MTSLVDFNGCFIFCISHNSEYYKVYAPSPKTCFHLHPVDRESHHPYPGQDQRQLERALCSTFLNKKSQYT